MKRIFTLIAGLLLISSGAFAQEKWANMVTNGNMEGAQDPKWSSFWCHDWRRGLGDFDPDSNQKYDNDDPENGQFQGFAEIIEDPVKKGNHCARVIARSEAEADAANNKVCPQGSTSLASWDCQFFIYCTEPIEQGKDVRMTLRVRADKAGKFETQAHWTPGDYNHYIMFGDVNVTTEWQKITSDVVTLSADQCKESDGKHFQTVAFNLSTDTQGNVFYFDDVKLEVRDHQEDDPQELSGWFNFLRKGTLSDDKITFGNGTFTNFTGRDGESGKDQQARIVEDALDGKPALSVTSIGFNATYDKENQVEVLDEDGNPVLDEDGNPTYDIEVETVDIHIFENGDTCTVQNGGYGIDAWQTQFFVSTPHVFKNGQKYKVVISARADKPAKVSTQIHRGPGDYLHYEMLGDLELTEEWQDFEFDDKTISGSQAGGSTIAFNCNELREVNNYYFRIEEFSANDADVTDDERTLDRMAVALPVPALDQDVDVKINMAPMMEKLGVENLTEFLNESTMKVTVLTPEEDGDELIPSLLKGFQATSGFFIDELGSMTDSDEGYAIEFPEDGIAGQEATIKVSNFKGPFEKGNTIQTKICFEKDENGWLYAYDLTLMDPEAYEAHAGIVEVTAQKLGNHAIYDLSGRKVSKPTKGLYIQDGKKFFK